jgi:hypothetical protein
MVTCEVFTELEQDTSISSVLVFLHMQLNHVETGGKFEKNNSKGTN